MQEKTVAQRVHSDIWDLFGALTQQQSETLKTYLIELEERGILHMPVQASVGTMKQPGDVPQPEPRTDQTE